MIRTGTSRGICGCRATTAVDLVLRPTELQGHRRYVAPTLADPVLYRSPSPIICRAPPPVKCNDGAPANQLLREGWRGRATREDRAGGGRFAVYRTSRYCQMCGSIMMLSKGAPRKKAKANERDNRRIVALTQSWIDGMFPGYGIVVEDPSPQTPAGPI